MLFTNVEAFKPQKSVFNLSYSKKFSCDMGQLVPVMCDEVVPGDTFEIGCEIVARLIPLVAPILHEIDVFTHYFFVPYRLLWAEPNGWQTFITGGVDGLQTPTLPKWTPTLNGVGTLWDHFGFPISIDPLGARPMTFPRDAYNLIYNEFYRDENLITPVANTNESVLIRAWEKDYFTSSLPWLQRGTAPALPITGHSHAIYPGNITAGLTYGGPTGANLGNMGYNTVTNVAYDAGTKATLQSGVATAVKADLDNNTVDLSSATTFTVNDLRLAFQTQRWLERNARSGARYTEFLLSHYGVSPKDERLQRPEYIGGSRAPLIVSEVLQTSVSAATPQGNMAGHGLSVDRRFCGKYHAKEFGLIMGIMSVMPKPAYQQGINRQWLRTTKLDFYTPEFAHLSEQAIIRAEIYANGVSNDNNTVFGYQGRFDEMRVKQNYVATGFRNSDYWSWHLGRIFGSAPTLNQTFVECVPDKRVFAVTNKDVLLINFANIIKAIRPMPIMAVPGLIDH